MRLWDPRSNESKPSGTHNDPSVNRTNRKIDSNKIRSPVVNVEWDSSGRRPYELFCATMDGRVKVFDIRKSGGSLQSNSKSDKRIMAACYSGDYEAIFAGGEDGNLKRLGLNRT